MVTVVHCDRCDEVIPEGSLHIVAGIGDMEGEDPHTGKTHHYMELCDACYKALVLWLHGLREKRLREREIREDR